jgi:hypothetical protein
LLVRDDWKSYFGNCISVYGDHIKEVKINPVNQSKKPKPELSVQKKTEIDTPYTSEVCY